MQRRVAHAVLVALALAFAGVCAGEPTTAAAQLTQGAATPAPAGSAAPSDTPSPSDVLDAVGIFDRVRARVAARVLPPFIAYTEYAAFERRGKRQAQRSRIVIRTADGKANITPVPDSPRDRIDTRPRVDRPIVYPTTSFGLVKRNTGEQASAYESSSAPQPAADAGAPAVIGRVSSRPRDYDPILIGPEQLAGASVYHLKLVPRADPEHHPIRDLWVDTRTFDPRRIAIEVWANAGPARSRPTVTVDFAPVDGTWLISQASMDFVLRFAFLSYGGSAAYHTSDISFPAVEPDWMFDTKLLAQHVQAVHSPPTPPAH